MKGLVLKLKLDFPLFTGLSGEFSRLAISYTVFLDYLIVNEHMQHNNEPPDHDYLIACT